MIVLLGLIGLIAWLAASAGVPWPVAIVSGIVGPLVLSSAWLKMTNREAPTRTLQPGDARTRRFLATLAERYRSIGFAEGARKVDEVLQAYESGAIEDANGRLQSLSASVSRSPASTRLIATWQNAWKDAS